MKLCSNCRVEKEISDFYSYMPYTCKKCISRRASRRSHIKRKEAGTKEFFRRKYDSKRRRVRSMGIEFSISFKDFMDLRNATHCVYCSVAPKVKTIDRIDHTKGYVPGNCVMSCRLCNRFKSNFGVKHIPMLENILKFLKQGRS